MKEPRSRLVWMGLAAVGMMAVIYFVYHGFGYQAGRDAALRDNRADAALEAQQNREG